MNNKNEFQELLNKTIETAMSLNHKIDVSQIKDIFSKMELNEQQFNQIFGYLIENKIEVIGYDLSNGITQDNQPKKINAVDSAYLEQYYNELKLIKEGTLEEEKDLLNRMKSGDKKARDRFIEINLQRVADIASEYKNRGMTVEDLIQEGNFGLMQSLDSLSGKENIEQAKEYIFNFVRKWIFDSLKDQQNNDDFENRVIEKSNHILESLLELEETMGERASIHELAEFMHISEEEIVETLEFVGDALELEEEEHEH